MPIKDVSKGSSSSTDASASKATALYSAINRDGGFLIRGDLRVGMSFVEAELTLSICDDDETSLLLCGNISSSEACDASVTGPVFGT